MNIRANAFQMQNFAENSKSKIVGADRKCHLTIKKKKYDK